MDVEWERERCLPRRVPGRRARLLRPARGPGPDRPADAVRLHPFGAACDAARREHVGPPRASAFAACMGYERRSAWMLQLPGFSPGHLYHAAALPGDGRRSSCSLAATSTRPLRCRRLRRGGGTRPAPGRPLAAPRQVGGAAHDTFWQAYAGGVDLVRSRRIWHRVARTVHPGLAPLSWAAAGGSEGWRLTPHGFYVYDDLERAVTHQPIEPLRPRCSPSTPRSGPPGSACSVPRPLRAARWAASSAPGAAGPGRPRGMPSNACLRRRAPWTTPRIRAADRRRSVAALGLTAASASSAGTPRRQSLVVDLAGGPALEVGPGPRTWPAPCWPAGHRLHGDGPEPGHGVACSPRVAASGPRRGPGRAGRREGLPFAARAFDGAVATGILGRLGPGRPRCRPAGDQPGGARRGRLLEPSSARVGSPDARSRALAFVRAGRSSSNARPRPGSPAEIVGRRCSPGHPPCTRDPR